MDNNNNTDEKCKVIADKLHKMCCNANHTDECSWYYYAKDDFSSGVKALYYRKAETLLSKHNFETLNTILSDILD